MLKFAVFVYLAGAFVMAHAELPDHYAESTMLFALSADGEQEVSLRLARFPLTGKATVWLHIADGEAAWAMAHEQFESSNQATPVNEDVAEFGAGLGTQTVKFVSQKRNGEQMLGHLSAELLAVASRHPELGEGVVPVSVDLMYRSSSAGYRSATGRWEMTGSVSGTVTVQGKTIVFDDPGKWHEQIGPRARFAPAFTYFNVQNESVALLAIAFAQGVSGYAMLNGEIYELQSFEIQGPDATPRKFEAQFYDARTDELQRIEGRARAVQQWSVPIEGQRRPGTAVIVETNLGEMFGSLNDWQPDK
ncbi:MAG: hypothetical protein NXH95_19395 [Pseudomonadaceae bacterium]|nr:hypothetical protein [Pseudomonadaceae bacterium]